MSPARAVLAGLALLLLAACSREQAATPQAPVEPVVVYASYEDRSYLPALFEAYTAATGVAVIVRQGAANAIVGDVIDNAITPPADVLMTPSVFGAYRAAEEGALRPIDAALLDASAIRDPDGFWVALSYRFAAIAYGPGGATARELTDPAELADPAFRGQLCLSSSTETMNRILIAGLIRRLGVREAELVVRGWIDNLARPVFATESELLDALHGGTCDIGIVSSRRAPRLSGEAGWPGQTVTLFDYVDAEAIGVARHARNPAGGLRLVEWLLSREVQERHAAAMHARPAVEPVDGGVNGGAIVWLNDEASLLAERARYP